MFCSCIFTKRHSHIRKNDCYMFHFPLVFLSASLFVSYILLLAFNIINCEALLIFLLSLQNCSFSLLVQTFVFFLFPNCFTLFPVFFIHLLFEWTFACPIEIRFHLLGNILLPKKSNSIFGFQLKVLYGVIFLNDYININMTKSTFCLTIKILSEKFLKSCTSDFVTAFDHVFM